MSVRDRVMAQFRHPRGLGGRLAGWVMATRASNRVRNLWTVELLALEASHRVLEIGCGPGIALAHVATRVTEGDIRAVDHSAAMVSQALARNRGAVERGHLHIEERSDADIPEAWGQFDRIFSVNVVQFWADPARAIEALSQRLRPGGLLAITYMPRKKGATADDATGMADRVVAWTLACGMRDARVERLDLRPVPAMCVLARTTADT